MHERCHTVSLDSSAAAPPLRAAAGEERSAVVKWFLENDYQETTRGHDPRTYNSVRNYLRSDAPPRNTVV